MVFEITQWKGRKQIIPISRDKITSKIMKSSIKETLKFYVPTHFYFEKEMLLRMTGGSDNFIQNWCSNSNLSTENINPITKSRNLYVIKK